MIVRSAPAAAFLLVAFSALAADAPSLTAVTPDVALGTIDPASVGPIEKAASIMVRSSVAWTVTVTAALDANTLTAPSSDGIEVKTTSGSWLPLLPAVPVAVSSGEPTADEGALVNILLRVKSTIDARPGMRLVTLHFAQPGQETNAVVQLRYEVATFTHLDDDPRPFESPAVNPARPGLYPYDRHHYVVHSNVPWAVDLIVGDVHSKSTANPLPPQTLVLLTLSGEATPVVAGQPLTLATGDATPRDGQPVDVQLAIRVPADGLAGGEYAADVKVVARPR